MVQSSARRVALAALKTWRRKKLFADTIIAQLLSEVALQSADRAFAVELFYGVLRNLSLLDFWIGALRPARIDIDLRDLLRLGLYQLFLAKTPEHAAVYETVELASNRHRPVVNGILRAAVRSKARLQTKTKSQALAVRFSQPAFLIERWERQFGEKQTKALCEWNNRPPTIYARINQLKTDRKKFLDRYHEASSVPTVANFVELSSPTDALAQGDCYVQDPSTAIACELLESKPGEKILDACAAPGGKTSYLAELMKNEGSLVAVDREAGRLCLLEDNLKRLGVKIATIVCHDWIQDKIPEAIRFRGPFDRILIDAPCSNTGVMRRRVDVRWRLKPADFQRMHRRQIEIAHAVIPLLKPNGILVYSTCSLEQEENEHVVHHLIQTRSELKLEEERHFLPFRERFDGAFAARLRQSA